MQALGQINSANITQTILTLTRNTLRVSQAHFTKNLSSKLVICTNLANAHTLNNNLTGTQNTINIALSNIDPALVQVPISLLDLMVYLNLRLGKNYIVIYITNCSR